MGGGRVHGRGEGLHGRGACVAGGHAWWEACMAGGHVWQGVMHGGRACMARGCAWQRGGARQILQDTVNERAVRILLECIRVKN